MALSHGRSYHKSAFAMDFLRPSLYISGESPTASRNDSRRPSDDSPSNSQVWRQVYESIVAAPDLFVGDYKTAGDQRVAGRRSSEVRGHEITSSQIHNPPVSITRQLAFGNVANDIEDGTSTRKCRCDCDRTCVTIFASVAIVAICFAGTLLLRVKEMEVERRLFESWLRNELGKNRTDSSLTGDQRNLTDSRFVKRLNGNTVISTDSKKPD